MSKIATLKLNNTNNRWEASFHGKVLTSSPSKEYVIEAMARGNNRTRKLGITGIQEMGTAMVAGADGVQEMVGNVTVEQEFPIQERFEIIEDYVSMVAQRKLASTLVTGQGGLGKTHIVMSRIKASGLKNITEMEIGARDAGQKGYVVVKGYSTPKGLFRTLYENRNQLVIFDDCDSVLRDPTAANLLKAALDSYDQRIITWNAEGWGDDDLPKSFEFKGGVIFISNLPKDKIPGPIRGRALCADVTMTRAEVVERMKFIVAKESFMPEFTMEMKQESMDFIEENAFNPMISELNLRSLLNVVKTRESKPLGWKRLALYTLANT